MAEEAKSKPVWGNPSNSGGLLSGSPTSVPKNQHTVTTPVASSEPASGGIAVHKSGEGKKGGNGSKKDTNPKKPAPGRSANPANPAAAGGNGAKKGPGAGPAKGPGGPGFIVFDDAKERSEIKECSDALKVRYDALKVLHEKIDAKKAEHKVEHERRDAALAGLRQVSEHMKLQQDMMRGAKKAQSERSRELEKLVDELPYRAPHDVRSPAELAAYNQRRITEEVEKLERDRELATTPGQDREISKLIAREEGKRRLVAEYLEATQRVLNTAAGGASLSPNMSMEDLRAQEDVKKKAFEAAKASESALKTQVDALFAERKTLKAEIDALTAKRSATHDALTVRKKAFDEKLAQKRKDDAARRQKMKEERDKRDAEYRERKEKETAAREEAEKTRVPFESELTLCDDAVAYLRPMAVTGGPKKGGKSKDLLLTHEPHVVSLFSQIGVDAPVFGSQVPETIAAIGERRKAIKERSDAEIEKRKQEALNPPPPPTEESKPEESPGTTEPVVEVTA